MTLPIAVSSPHLLPCPSCSIPSLQQKWDLTGKNQRGRGFCLISLLEINLGEYAFYKLAWLLRRSPRDCEVENTLTEMSSLSDSYEKCRGVSASQSHLLTFSAWPLPCFQLLTLGKEWGLHAGMYSAQSMNNTERSREEKTFFFFLLYSCQQWLTHGQSHGLLQKQMKNHPHDSGYNFSLDDTCLWLEHTL